MSKTTWEVGTNPTPEQFADWFVSLERERQIEVAGSIIDASDVAHDCLIRDHAGSVEQQRWLRETVARLRVLRHDWRRLPVWGPDESGLRILDGVDVEGLLHEFDVALGDAKPREPKPRPPRRKADQ